LVVGACELTRASSAGMNVNVVGPGLTVMYPVLVLVLVPEAFVTLSETLYVPAAAYVKGGLWTVESTVPSFWKSQAHAVGVPVEASVNWTARGAGPEVGAPVKSAT